MLKSLEKLRDGIYNANEIQAEVDNCYLPLPLFEDGEPAHLGDEFYCPDLGTLRIYRIHYASNYVQIITDIDTSCVVYPGERLKRPPEPDTQEKIDADLMLPPCEYCDKRGLDCASYDGPYSEWPNVAMRKDLLARQRKLDGVE